MIIASSALKSVLANPWAAIAIGAAMVAAAAVMTALINKNAEKSEPALAKGGLAYGPTYAMVGDNPNAGTDPEVIACRCRSCRRCSRRAAARRIPRITLGGQLTAKGRDLVYVLGKRELQVGGVGWVIFLSLYLGNIIERPDTPLTRHRISVFLNGQRQVFRNRTNVVRATPYWRHISAIGRPQFIIITAISRRLSNKSRSLVYVPFFSAQRYSPRRVRGPAPLSCAGR